MQHAQQQQAQQMLLHKDTNTDLMQRVAEVMADVDNNNNSKKNNLLSPAAIDVVTTNQHNRVVAERPSSRSNWLMK